MACFPSELQVSKCFGTRAFSHYVLEGEARVWNPIFLGDDAPAACLCLLTPLLTLARVSSLDTVPQPYGGLQFRSRPQLYCRTDCRSSPGPKLLLESSRPRP